ncbi:MAG TPA: hypothetical protein VN226_09220 [Anaerolineales bacterium]|nr:hypothetical protein [Anaerolineales bacterium]
MPNNSRSIFHLQLLHTAVLKLKDQLQDLKKLLDDDSGMRRQEINLKAARGLLIKHEQEQKKLISESEQLSLSIRDHENRLYSGKVKTPKEMVELEHELKNQRARLKELEDLEFNNLSTYEDLTGKLEQVTVEFQAYVARHEQDMQEWSQHAAELNENISIQTLAINELKSQIPAEIISHFERLLLSKNQIAVCLIEEDCCAVCGTLLSKQVVISSRSAEIPNTCPTCNRMLYNNI